MNPRKHSTALTAMFVVAIASQAHAGTPVNTAITYQGQFKEAGIPLSGNVDLRFELFDAEAGGSSVGSPLSIRDVAVIKGLFSAELDFGPGAFTGEARWVQIEVRNPHDPTDTEAFTRLAPRQALTATPYALYSLAPWRKFGANVSYAGGNVGIGTTNPSQALHISAGLPIVNIQDSDSLGAEQTGYVRFADEIGSECGWVGFGSQSNSDVSLMNNQAGGNTYLGAGGSIQVAVTPSGNVGVGVTAPDVPLHVEGGTDATPTGGGYIQAGSTSSVNIVIDENEIMARDNGQTSNLHINNNGGNVIFGGKIVANAGFDLGYEMIVRTEQDVSTTFARCSEGKKVIGGGCETDAGGDALNLSRPIQNETSWQCSYDTGVFGGAEITAYAFCINVPD